MNNWKIVQIFVTEVDGEEEQEIQSNILQNYAHGLSDQTVFGDYASLQCEDEEDNVGYYVVQWTSLPYTPHDGKHELMCSAVYLDREPQVKDGYYNKMEQ